MTAEQRLEPAVQLLAAASERLQEAAQSPFYGPRFQAVYRESQAATEAALDTEAYKRTWASGLALSLDQAADLALAQLIRIAPTEAELHRDLVAHVAGRFSARGYSESDQCRTATMASSCLGHTGTLGYAQGPLTCLRV